MRAPTRDSEELRHGPGCRPYIDYARMRAEYEALFPGKPFTTKVKDARLPYRFTEARVKRGHLDYAVPRMKRTLSVVIEPHNKALNPNREWGWERWQRVADLIQDDYDLIQIDPVGSRVLRGVAHVPANTFPEAARILSGAALYVGPEGGLYHAAAAYGTPAVALFGGFVSPETQGYPGMDNLYAPEGSPCGQRVPCPHCRAALDGITPEDVAARVKERMRIV